MMMASHLMKFRQTARLAIRNQAKKLGLAIVDDAAAAIFEAVVNALPSRRWFVGITKEKQEGRASTELIEQGFEVYLPKIHIRHQIGRKIEVLTGLRFTGYILIAFDLLRDDYGRIKYTGGMDGDDGMPLLCNDGKPVPLPDGIVRALRAIENVDFASARGKKSVLQRPEFLPGMRVRFPTRFHADVIWREGTYFGAEGGDALIAEGILAWRVPLIDLKRIEPREGKAA